MSPGHPIILLKSNQFNMAAVSVKRSIKKYFLPKKLFHLHCRVNYLVCLVLRQTRELNKTIPFLPTAWKPDLFWLDRNKTDLWIGRRKAFYFCRLRPADAIVSSLLSYDDIFLTEGCREKHLAWIISNIICSSISGFKSFHRLPYEVFALKGWRNLSRNVMLQNVSVNQSWKL